MDPLTRILVASFLLLVVFASANENPRVLSVKKVIELSQQRLIKERVEEHWDYPSYLGQSFISQYYLFLALLRKTDSKMDIDRFRSQLIHTQRADGGWVTLEDPQSKKSDINASVLNYWALKSISNREDVERLKRAKNFIVSEGGLRRINLMLKFQLAMFGNYEWKKLPNIPMALFSSLSPIKMGHFAQWIGPHIMPLAYLRHFKVVRDLGPSFRLDELDVSEPRVDVERDSDHEVEDGVMPTARNLVNLILESQRGQGSWGGYTTATLFSVLVLDDAKKRFPKLEKEMVKSRQAGWRFLESRYFDTRDSAYLGATNDGRYWDTALITKALSKSELGNNELRNASNYLASSQLTNGGFPFGIDFERDPDTDDTAEIILALHPFQEHEMTIRRAVNFLVGMQNLDGGWAAFTKDQTPLPIVDHFISPFKDSAAIYDDSSPDVTGHVLESLAIRGITVFNSAVVRKAVDYLFRTQDAKTGSWFGRWGVNHLYGTSAAVVGLLKVGVPRNDIRVERAIQWLQSKQNSDGGFGEAVDSYRDSKLHGKGLSSPTQTAWVMIALTEASQCKTDGFAHAVDYLIRSHDSVTGWRDESPVGTGHPGLVYMQYPSYAKAFPLEALAGWLSYFKAVAPGN